MPPTRREAWAAACAAVLMLLIGCESIPPPTSTGLPTSTPTGVASAAGTVIPTAASYPAPYPFPSLFAVTVPAPPTPLPTATATPNSLPTTVPPIQTVTADRLPSLPHDLLFISHQQLLRWNNSTKRVEQLADAVKQFDVSRDGKHIALLVQHSKEEDQVALFALPSKRLTVLAGVPAITLPWYWRGPTLAISPDGQWIAYVRNHTLLPNESTVTPTQAPSRPPTQYIDGDLFITRTDTSNRTVQLAHCARMEVADYEQTACFDMTWSSDSRVLAWADTRGLWLAQLDQTPHLLKPYLSIPPEGPAKRLEFWQPRRFSSSGQYLLALVGLYEGGEWGIVDSHTGQSDVIPETLIYGGPYADVAWLRDERLFVVSGTRMWEASPPTAYLWRIQNTSALTVTDQFTIGISKDASNTAIAPVQFDNGQLAFGMSNESPTNYLERGLYTLDLSARKPLKLTGMPPRPISQLQADPQVFWSRDGKAAVILNVSASDQVLDEKGNWRIFAHTVFAPTNGSALYDISPIVGDDACCFVWLN